MPTGQVMFPIEKSSLMHLWELEKVEIDKVKWIESEKIGKDCGLQYAEWQWVMRFRQNWISGMKVSGFY